MKISVIGARGMVGSAIAQEAADRDHEVARYARSAGEGVQALDFGATEDVVAVVGGSDVTVVSVAGRDNYDAIRAAHQALIAAKPTGRLIVVGGAGALQVGEVLLYQTPDFPAEYFEEAQTFAGVLEDYRASEGLNWTVVAPSPVIQPGVRTGEYVTERDTLAGTVVSTQDFAVAILDEAENPQFAGTRFTVASKDEAAAQG